MSFVKKNTKIHTVLLTSQNVVLLFEVIFISLSVQLPYIFQATSFNYAATQYT